MMSRKLMLIAACLLAVCVLTAGLPSAPAFADDGPLPPRFKLLDRVAQILNIDRQALADAFIQAGTEMRQAQLNSLMDKWVADGKLAPDQADQYRAWLAAKPAGPFGPLMGPKVMDRLLKDGRITQAQYGAWKSWWDRKPAFELPKPERPVGPAARRMLQNSNRL